MRKKTFISKVAKDPLFIYENEKIWIDDGIMLFKNNMLDDIIENKFKDILETKDATIINKYNEMKEYLAEYFIYAYSSRKNRPIETYKKLIDYAQKVNKLFGKDEKINKYWTDFIFSLSSLIAGNYDTLPEHFSSENCFIFHADNIEKICTVEKCIKCCNA